ncbi:MAG: hypothetical protein WB615_09265 [Candidatus Tumulicola sp.]
MDLQPISLEQALLDVEIAHARVIDLTRRLIEMNDELGSLRSELARFRLRGFECGHRSEAELENKLFEALALLESERLRHQRDLASAQRLIDEEFVATRAATSTLDARALERESFFARRAH